MNLNLESYLQNGSANKLLNNSNKSITLLCFSIVREDVLAEVWKKITNPSTAQSLPPEAKYYDLVVKKQSHKIKYFVKKNGLWYSKIREAPKIRTVKPIVTRRLAEVM